MKVRRQEYEDIGMSWGQVKRTHGIESAGERLCRPYAPMLKSACVLSTTNIASTNQNVGHRANGGYWSENMYITPDRCLKLFPN